MVLLNCIIRAATRTVKPEKQVYSRVYRSDRKFLNCSLTFRSKGTKRSPRSSQCVFAFVNDFPALYDAHNNGNKQGSIVGGSSPSQPRQRHTQNIGQLWKARNARVRCTRAHIRWLHWSHFSGHMIWFQLQPSDREWNSIKQSKQLVPPSQFQ